MAKAGQWPRGTGARVAYGFASWLSLKRLDDLLTFAAMGQEMKAMSNQGLQLG